MAINAGIEVAGLREFQRGLKRLNPELDKQLKVELQAIAQTVADDAAVKVPTRSGQARRSIRAGADAKGPFVKGGKKKVPYYGWLDFGSRNPNIGAPRRFGPWTQSGAGPKRGRFIYPAIDRNLERIASGGAAALARAKADADIE